MKRFLLGLTCVAIFAAAIPAAEKDSRLFELRVYSVEKGKQAAVSNFIAKSGIKYMKKHNVELLGAWVPADASDERVITLLAHKDKESAEKNVAAYMADEGFRKEITEAMKDGPVITGVARFFLNATDYSPPVKAANAGDRIFELRTYVATPNNLDNLNARFRDHTVKLFEKHGMTNVAYFTFGEGEKTTVGDLLKGCSAAGKDASDVKPDTEAKPLALVYLITHKSPDARDENFSKFGRDPEWNAARTNSERKGGGSLTAKNAVKSLILKSTEYSPIK